ncbi:unnamed protein product [Soboliphyme baturini]|uniref:Transposase n=1 Tax=Soboliphyme baturini TaxID=241478 RepID=A0A183IFR8_9BILA|nr:unnamed protein product [Soboliphyme baturini]
MKSDLKIRYDAESVATDFFTKRELEEVCRLKPISLCYQRFLRNGF